MLAAAATAGAATAAATAALLTYGVRSPRSSLLAPTVYKGRTGRRAVALTFDDGPSESTPALLDILARYRAKATFYQVGASVRRLPAIAREVAAAGHEIGNHSDTHPLMSLKSAAFIAEELRRAQQTIAEHAGVTPRTFRAPFGVRWFGMRAAQRDLHLTGVSWTVIGLDWKLPATAISNRVLSAIQPDGIICLHDGRVLAANPNISVTLEAVRHLCERLTNEGYSFNTVSELLCLTN